MATVATSSKFSLNGRDILKGLLMAALVPALTIISQSVNAGSLVFNWKSIAIAAISGGLAYLLKNFLTPSEIVLKDAAPETVAQVKEGNAEVKVMPTK